jgi:hypothetical protein
MEGNSVGMFIVNRPTDFGKLLILNTSILAGFASAELQRKNATVNVTVSWERRAELEQIPSRALGVPTVFIF